METPKETEYSTEGKLYIALELSQSHWKLGMGTGIGQGVRIRTITAKDKATFIEEIRLARAKYKLSENAEVVCCYEAGLDGFWIHRWLTAIGVTNVVVDSASIEVTRRAKQRKTDRLDVEKLLRQLMRYAAGEQDVWKVVHVPSAEEEDQRHLHRQLLSFKADRVQASESDLWPAENPGRGSGGESQFPGRNGSSPSVEWEPAAAGATGPPAAGVCAIANGGIPD